MRIAAPIVAAIVASGAAETGQYRCVLTPEEAAQRLLGEVHYAARAGAVASQ